jgi:hypothetical protein
MNLDDIHALPNNPTLDDLAKMGFFPPAPPPPSIIPKADKVAPMAPVTPMPGAFRIGTGIGRDTTQPTTNAPISSPVPPPTAPIKSITFHAPEKASSPTPRSAESPLSPLPAAPDMATPGIVPPPGGAASPFGGEMKLAPLNFHQRQALPTTSEGVPSGSPGEALAKLQRMQDQDQNPYGSAENHPGILGKIGHYLAKAGNIAGNIVAPATMANIPGTDLNRREQEHELNREVQGREKAQEEALNSASERDLRAAEAERARREGSANLILDAAGNVRGWHDEKGGLHSIDDADTPEPIKKIAEHWEGKPQAQDRNESIEQGLARASKEYLEKGGDPAKMGEDPIVSAWQKLRDDNAKASGDKTPPHVTAMKGGKPHIMERDPATGEYTIDRGEAPPNYAMVAPVLQQRTFTQQEKMFDLRQQALTAATKSMIETAPTVLHLAQRIDPLIDKLHGELGPAAGRWNEFWTGKVGVKNADYMKMRSDLSLLKTALSRMHVGAKGGIEMINHFNDLIDGAKQDPENMKAALAEIETYAHELQERGVQGGMNPKVLGVGEGGGGGAKGEPPGPPAAGMKWQQNKRTGEYRQVPEKQ